MNGRTRKLGLAGLVVGGTLLFGVGFAGAQSPSGDGSSPPKATHTGGSPIVVGDVRAGSGGCGGDGGATASVVSSLDL